MISQVVINDGDVDSILEHRVRGIRDPATPRRHQARGARIFHTPILLEEWANCNESIGTIATGTGEGSDMIGWSYNFV